MSANLVTPQMGRPPIEIDLNRVRALLSSNPLTRVAEIIGVSSSTIYNRLGRCCPQMLDSVRASRPPKKQKRGVMGRPPVEIDLAAVQELLPQCGHSVRRVARVLGISQSTLHYRLKNVPRIERYFATRAAIQHEVDFLRHQTFVRRVARRASATYRAFELPRLMKLEAGIGREFCSEPDSKFRACGSCGVTKRLSEFYFHKASQVFKRACKACCRKSSLYIWHERGKFTRAIIGRRSYSKPVVKLTECYPYLLSNALEGASLLETIHNLVPRSLSEAVRADVCQEMVLAVLSGEIEIENLSKYVRQYIKTQSAYLPSKYEASLDAPISLNDGHRYSLIDTISTDDYNDAWGVKNHYGSALSDCEGAEDLAERLSSAWEANRLKTPSRRTYNRFSATHEEDNRGRVAPLQVSGRVGMHVNARRYRYQASPRTGIERKLDNLAWATDDYLEQRIAEEREALSAYDF
jgi:regulatory Fis family protein